MSGRTCRTASVLLKLNDPHVLPSMPILKRIERNKDFFERAWKMQVQCTALFGPQVEETFLLIQRARRKVEVSAQMLLRDPEPDAFRADVWPAYGALAKGGDEVGRMLTEFKEKMEALCRPIIDKEYGKKARKWNWKFWRADSRRGGWTGGRLARRVRWASSS